MPESSLLVLLGAAASIGLIHTVTGPDHYLPFVAMARIGRWSLGKTIVVTLCCGVGHVAGSIILGALGIGLGLAVGSLAWFEGLRGSLAGWLLLGFGLGYFAWGVKRALRNRPHRHIHAHADGLIHEHTHTHEHEHVHVHDGDAPAAAMTPWILFAIFVFGPCEPLIPLLMFPAAKLGGWSVVLVAGVFAVSTLTTMTAMVLAGYFGLAGLSLPRLHRCSHALAGLALIACGAAMQIGL